MREQYANKPAASVYQSDRGSILLALIAGIVVLAVLGTSIVTLMTGSLMSGVVAQESAQARYLAESGLAVVRSRLNVGTSATLLAQVDKLHQQQTVFIPDVGEVDLALYPRWFHTGAVPAGFPLHAGGFLRDNPEFPSTASFVTQSRDGTTSLLAASDPLPEHADIYLAGLLDRTRSRLVNTGTARWSLTVVPLHGVKDFAAFPARDGLIGLVDDSGILAVDKSFQYQRLRMLDDTCIFEELRPAGHADGEPLPAARFLPQPMDFMDKDLVLGQHVTVEVLSRTLNGSRDSLRSGLNGNSSFRPDLLDPETAFPGIGEPVLGGVESLSGKTVEEAQDARDDLFGSNVRGSTTFESDGTSENRVDAYLRETAPAEENHFLKRAFATFTSDFWAAALTRAGVETWKDVRLSVALVPPSKSSNSELLCSRFAGLLFRVAFAHGGDTLTDAGVVGLGMGVLDGSVELENALFEGTEILSVVQSAGTTVNPSLLPGFVAVPRAAVSLPQNPPIEPVGPFKPSVQPTLSLYPAPFLSYSGQPLQTFIISKADWSRYQTLYRDPSVMPGIKRLKPLVVVWAYDDRDAMASFNWLAVGIQPFVVSNSSKKSRTVRLFARIQEQKDENHIRAWFASEKASAPVHWQFTSEQAQLDDTPKPTVVTTPLAIGEAFTRTGIFQGVYRTDGTPPTESSFVFRDFTVGMGE